MKLIIEKNIPIPKNEKKEIVEAIMGMKDGESAYLSYDTLKKTTISNAIASARIRISMMGLSITYRGDANGVRIWVFKKEV